MNKNIIRNVAITIAFAAAVAFVTWAAISALTGLFDSEAAADRGASFSYDAYIATLTSPAPIVVQPTTLADMMTPPAR